MTAIPRHLKFIGIGVLTSFLLFSCSSYVADMGVAGSSAPSENRARTENSALPWNTPVSPEKVSERPGLATGWGKKKSSKVSYTQFSRASTKPYGKVETIYYNDKEGVDATAGHWRWGRKGLHKSKNGLVEWGVKQGVSTLRSYNRGGKRYVEGSEGRNYAIVIKNICHSRLEAVVSVDGLDVLNGRPASTRNEGHVISPGETLTIKGFRTSAEAVAAFKFSSVSSSYSAEKYGNTRNVGVIGLALFTEKGVDPWKWSTREIQERTSATPFAQQ